jgi:DNA-binding transcriptional ArsR family regulator
MFTQTQSRLPECEIHTILSNPRRRAAIKQLCSSPGTISVRDLSEVIAATETGQTPAPRNVRESVYISLHQTHLPKLHELGVIEYDRELKEVYLLDAAKDLDRYMDVVTAFGVTWGGYYRSLGVFGLAVVVAALAGVPGLAAVDPLLWASGFLGAFSLSTAYQLWTDRWNVLRSLRR